MSRRRNIINACPPHIDPRKLPVGCYWDKSGNGHWFTTFKIDGIQKRKKIAGPTATMAELYKAIELHKGCESDNLIWLGAKFRESIQYRQVSKASRKDWDYCAGVVERHPSKRPGLLMGKAPLQDWSPPIVQKLIDEIAAVNGPSAAAHCARYLRRLFGWAANRGHVRSSPVGRLELPKERKRRRLPDLETVGRLVMFAKDRGDLPAHTKGSCSPFIWPALVISYQCRLRGVEVFDLTDDKIMEEGLLCKRRKGSAANLTRWNPDLRAAVKSAQAYRDALWDRLKKAVPMKPEQRQVLVNTDGLRIKSSAWQTAWRRFMALAVAAGIITAEQRFGLHDMKRRGATDTKGTRQEKMLATGHKSAAMLDVYDFSVPTVDAAGE